MKQTKRMLAVVLIVLMLVTAAPMAGFVELNLGGLFAVNVSAKQDLQGVWKGTYIGHNNHSEAIERIIEIELFPKADGLIEGIAYIDNEVKGKYYFTGSYNDATGKISFKGKEWIDNPGNFEFCQFSGAFESNTMIGTVNGNSERSFRLIKISDSCKTEKIDLKQVTGIWVGEYDGRHSGGRVVRRCITLDIFEIDAEGNVKGKAFVTPSDKEDESYGVYCTYWFSGFINALTRQISIQGNELIEMTANNLKNWSFVQLSGTIDLNKGLITGKSENGIWSMKTKSQAVSTFSLSDRELSLFAGDTKELTTSLSHYDITITWKSNNKNIAKVNSKGVVSALNPGKCTITATVDGVSASCLVTVKEKPSVPTPTGLKVAGYNTTVIKLTWNKVNGATGYVVYQYNASTKKYKKLDSTKGNSYEVTKLNPNTTYQFAVKAYKTVDGKFYYSGYSALAEATTVVPSPLKFKYNSVFYQSAAYDDYEDNSGWQTVEEAVIKSGQFDWAKAVVGAISANSGDALSPYYNIRKGSAIDHMDLAGSVISMAHGFVCGGREGINDVTMKLQTNGKENRMLLMYGQPIETAYSGQTLYYSEILINAHGGDTAYFLSAGKDADKAVRNIFSGLEPDGRYDLKIKFSKMKDWEDSPYKYSIVIGNNGNVLQHPIFHNGTKVELVYYGTKEKKGYTVDVTRLLNSETIIVEGQVGEDIINFLNNGSWKKNAKNQTISTSYDNYVKTLGSKAFSLGAKAKTPLSYTSDNKRVATVSSTGKVTIVGVGRAKIKIIATGTEKYNTKTKTVTITVKPKAPAISKIIRSSAEKAVVKWKSVDGVTGYKIQYSANKDMSSAKTVSKSSSSYTINGLKNKKYYVRVRAYQTVNKVNYFSAWSSVKTIKKY